MGSAAVLAFAGPAAAEMRPTLSFAGVPGLIDMPGGEHQSDGMLSFTGSTFGSISHQTLTFQIAPWVSGSFRYGAVRNWDDVIESDFSTYLDRSFDLRFRITEEGQYVPAITVGFQDFIGTSLSQAEYIVATKTFADKIKVTAGLGWGRLASNGGGGGFGTREPIDIGEGGTPHIGNWFKGDIAPFAGIEWKVSNKLTFKAEYSSDAYTTEAEERQTFDYNSPFNFGLTYHVSRAVDLGLYSMYGSSVGAVLSFQMDPYRRPQGGMLGPGPVLVPDRPSAEGWSGDWVSDKGRLAALQKETAKLLRHDGIAIQSMQVGARSVTIVIDSTQLDNAAQAVGRTARALAATMPPSVEVFEIVPVARSIPVTKVVVRRSDLAQLQFAAGQDALMQERTQILPVSGAPLGDPIQPVNLEPRFTWNIAPFIASTLFNPDNPLDLNIGLRLRARYELAPGLFLIGTVTKSFGNNHSDIDEDDSEDSDGDMPPVRTDGEKYAAFGDPAIKTLALAWYAKPAPDIYTRVTAGYLEQMFGGVSAEILWMPTDKPYAFGAEFDLVQQRNYDQLFGFRDYRAGVGFVSGYYMFDNGINAELDVGRFLAGDYGARIVVDRQFANGWKVGAFATFTDASFEEFGEGSFDKGIIVEIPFGWFLGKPTQQTSRVVLRPLLRNGGAGLDLDGRLYDTMRDYRQQDLDFAWGRFWR